jgi:hypothetical protein
MLLVLSNVGVPKILRHAIYGKFVNEGQAGKKAAPVL